jgi:AcrR family transcriptional regulator
MLRADRRAQLIEVSYRILRRDGVKALTMERLSEEARISKPVVYSHFENRSALIVALLEDHWAYLDSVVPQKPAAGQTFENYLRHRIGVFFDAIADVGGGVHLLYRATEDPLVEQARRNRERRVTAAWVAVSTAHNNISRGDAEIISRAVRSAMEFAAVRALNYPKERKKVQRVTVEIAVAAWRTAEL